jgi:uncharacterized protein (UPF0332 family)
MKGGTMHFVFLDKAQANLAAAQHCFDNGFYEASANRAYCAAFQAAVAALAAQGIRSDKNEHKWVQAHFNGELIWRRKIYPSKLRAYLSDMLTMRNEADYSETRLSKGAAQRQFVRAREFVETIIMELQQ